MKRTRSPEFAVLVLLAFLWQATSRSIAAEYVEIASSPEGGGVTGLSADGRVVIGYGFDPSWDGRQGWRWTREDGVTLLPSTVPGGWVNPVGVSTDGSIIVGRDFEPSGPGVAFRWTEETGTIQIVPDGQFEYSFARDVSNSGVVTARGVSGDTNTPFRWTEAGGLEVLDELSVWETPMVSDDARVLAGTLSSGSGFVWNQHDSVVDLGVLPGKLASRVREISGDGSVVVGQSALHASADIDAEAFRWTEETGMVGLGFLPGLTGGSWATDVTSDGTVIVGTSENFSIAGIDTRKSFVWDAQHGMRDLHQVLRAEHGMTNLPPLTDVMGISDDKMTLAGWILHANRSGTFLGTTSWAIYLDKPLVSFGIPGDYNNNGLVEQEDLDLVLAHWGSDGTAPPATWTNDLPTGNIDQTELDGVLANWGNTTAAVGTAAVPEPGTAVLLLIGLTGLLAHKHNRCRGQHNAG